MASYNYQYNPSYDNQATYSERSSQVFWDAVSITSSDRNSIALSVYHSVPELHHEDENARNIRNSKVIMNP